jgi:hypothetical protein
LTCLKYAGSRLADFDMIQIKAGLPSLSDKCAMSKHSLTRDVVIAIGIKLVVVTAAALFVFSPGQRPKLDAGTIATRLIGTDAGSPQQRKLEP